MFKNPTFRITFYFFPTSSFPLLFAFIILPQTVVSLKTDGRLVGCHPKVQKRIHFAKRTVKGIMPFLCFIEHALATIVIIRQGNFKQLIIIATTFAFLVIRKIVFHL